MYIKKKIAIIGSTGSIGKNTLNVIKKYKNFFSLELLICDCNIKSIESQINNFSPKYVYVNNLEKRICLKKKIKKKIIIIDDLNQFLLNAYSKKKIDKTIIAVSSIEGLKYSFEFIKYSKQILIANKESIICGGNILLNQAKKFNCDIVSIDSEHYSINQIKKNINLSDIDKVYLTASGGPFLQKKMFKKSSIEMVTAHPKWKMGMKISVDSATMVNKIFEIIEAHVLFKIPFSKIKIKIHKESMVHCAIVLNNGLVYLVAHDTSMIIPIRNSLFDNKFFNDKKNSFKNNLYFNYTFDEKNLNKYRILKTGLKIAKFGQAGWILFNVVNDMLVKRFLKKEIFFYQIEETLISIFSKKIILKYCQKKIKSIFAINNAILYAKNILLK